MKYSFLTILTPFHFKLLSVLPCVFLGETLEDSVIAKLSQAKVPAGLSSHPAIRPDIQNSIIFKLGPCWAVAWLGWSYLGG